jgi:hypothetical protein
VDVHLGYKANLRDKRFLTMINIQKMDFCNFMENRETYSRFINAGEWVEITFPKFFHKCPYKVRTKISRCCSRQQTNLNSQNINVINAAMDIQKEKEIAGDWQKIFLNGYYQYKVKFYDDIDDNIYDQTSVHIWRKS